MYQTEHCRKKSIEETVVHKQLKVSLMFINIGYVGSLSYAGSLSYQTQIRVGSCCCYCSCYVA